MLRNTLLAGLLVTAALVSLAGLAYAAIPAGNGTISACKDNKGTLKVIDAEAGASCPSNQQQLTWNQQGPPGVSGYEVVHGSEAVAVGDWQVFVAMCPPGKKVVGGGVYSTTGLQRGLVISSEYPTSDNDGWVGVLTETIAQPDTWTGRAVAVCASVD
jgi:hypothetical protein